MDDGARFDLDSAELRAASAGLAVSIEVLAAKLRDALPRATTVTRRSRRLRSRQRGVERVEVRLGDHRYTLEARDGATGRREQEVRGVVIRREELGLDAWIEALAAELREHARTSAEAQDALERLLG